MKPSSHISPIMGNRGVTLIELLVAVAITVIVGASIVGALYSGRSAWESGDNIIRRHQNARAAIDFISRDLQQAFVFPDGALYMADFGSTDDDLQFTALIGNPEEGFDLMVIHYQLDTAENILNRIEYMFGAPTPPPSDWDPVAWDIEELEFDFFFWDAGAWQESGDWQYGTEGRLPERVRIRVTPLDSERVESIVKIPLSTLRPYPQP